MTAIAGQSNMIAVRNGDVLTVYLDGLAGDTTTPDTSVRWFELRQHGAGGHAGGDHVGSAGNQRQCQRDGALIVTNANVTGYGVRTSGAYGQYNAGRQGVINQGTGSGVGVRNEGVTVAIQNVGNEQTTGQIKVTANVDSEGALHLVNSNTNGIGLMTSGGSAGFGQRTPGASANYDLGTVTGAKHEGAVTALENNASGASGQGVYDVALNTGGEGHVMEGTTYDLTADIHGAVSGSVGSIATGGIAAASFAAGAIDASAIAADAIGSSELAATAVNEIADQVWDEAIAGHLTAGTTGAKLNLIGTAAYTVTSPVSSDGTAITIVRGDDYLLTDGRQLAFTSTGWPTITGATVKLRVKFGKTATITEYSATVTGPKLLCGTHHHADGGNGARVPSSTFRRRSAIYRS